MPHYDYPMPTITTDVVVFKNSMPPINRFDEIGLKIGNVQVLLIKRGNDPFKDHWALVGEHFEPLVDTSITACAARGLKEEISVFDYPEDCLLYLSYKDEMGRDPRGRYISFVFAAEIGDEENPKAADDAAEFAWFPVQDLKDEKVKLAFDHQEIINEFIDMFFGPMDDE